jgi:PAS domain S-box-containing protein
MTLLLVYCALISGSVALYLLCYQATRKTYPGFGYWTAGVAFVAASYFLYGLRSSLPLWVSVFGGNLAMPLGLLLQLDGIRRFLALSPLRWSYLTVSAGLAVALAVFSFHWDSIYWRGFSTSLPMIAIQWYMAALLFRAQAPPRSAFIKVFGSLLVLGGFFVLVRIVWFLSLPTTNLVWIAKIEFVFFIGFLAVHIGESLSMIMLNAERVEGELVGAQQDLSRTVSSLREALAQQKQAEESLRDSEERYRTFFDTSRDAVFMTTLDGRFIEFNDVALEMLGYANSQRQEVLGRAVSEFYAHPEESESHAAIVAKQGFSKEYPVDFRRQDGTIIHTVIMTVARKKPAGNIIGFQGTVRDVTEARHAQEALQQKTHDLGQRVKELNCLYNLSKLIESPGISVDQILRGVVDLMPSAWQYPEITCAKIMLEGREFKTENCRDTVDKLSADMVVHGENIGFVDVGYLEERPGSDEGPFVKQERDLLNAIAQRLGHVIERIKASEALKASEERFQLIAETATDIICCMDKDYRLTYVSPADEKLRGFKAEEVIGQPIFTVAKPSYLEAVKEVELRRREEEERGIETGTIRHELELVCKDGSYIWTEGYISPTRDQSGKISGFVGIARDTSDRIRAEQEKELMREQLFQAQKMDSIGTRLVALPMTSTTSSPS